MKKLILIVGILLGSVYSLFAQPDQKTTDLESITATLNDYIIGTSNGEPDRLKRAFHPDFNLYTVTEDTLRIRNGQKYISYFKEGEKKY
jgi:hypothetical protein